MTPEISSECKKLMRDLHDYFMACGCECWEKGTFNCVHCGLKTKLQDTPERIFDELKQVMEGK